MKRFYALAALACLLGAGSALAQTNDAKALNVSLKLNEPLNCAITVDQDLTLVATLPSSGSATYQADPVNGKINTTGTGASVDATNSTLGQFSVSVSGASLANLNIVAPPSLSGPNGSSVNFAVAWAQENGGNYQAISGNSVSLTSGTHTFRVGGTIDVPSNAEPGAYSSSIDLVVTCNN